MGSVGQANAMMLLLIGAVTALYLLLWPFSLRLDGRLSASCGRAELIVASLFRLRLEGDFLQPLYFSVFRLDSRGCRQPLGGGGGGFAPVIGDRKLWATLYVGAQEDGALTVEALGLLYVLLETLGKGWSEEMALRPVACFDRNICALQVSGIGRFVLAQNILEYLKGKIKHAKR